MNPHLSRSRALRALPFDRGFVLIGGLLFLVIITLLAMAMFRSFGLEERIAGNTRDKQRAFEAAQSALQYGEWWLSQSGGAGTGVVCSGAPVNANDVKLMKVCSAALATPEDPSSWPAQFDYRPQGMKDSANGGLVTPGGDIYYKAVPSLYINYLSKSTDGLADLYQVTAVGHGGNSDTAAVVRSTYQMKAAEVNDLEKLR